MRRLIPFLDSASKSEGKPGAAARKAGASRETRSARGERAARRRARARWMRPTFRVGAVVTLVAAVGFGGYHVWSRDYVGQGLAAVDRAVLDATMRAGLTVERVLVTGRRETRRVALIEALDVETGSPILALDIAAARERVERIGWVARATVERRLPSTVFVSVEERTPLAIWQREGRFVLIDPVGEVIGQEGLDRYRHLPVVVGEGAPRRAAALLALLETEPALKARVEAAVWVGERRWNVKLDNGIDIRLPEDDAAGAWNRLARLEREHNLLARAIEAIDMRQPDRLIVRMTEEAAERRKARKDET